MLFLQCETEDQINNFLEKHDGFKPMKLSHKTREHTKLIKNNYIITMPTQCQIIIQMVFCSVFKENKMILKISKFFFIF